MRIVSFTTQCSFNTTLCDKKKAIQKNGFSAYVRMFYIIAICGTNQIEIGYFFDSYYMSFGFYSRFEIPIQTL
jgi:hypothetical protein